MPFQSSIMFSGEAGAYLSGALLYGRLLASPTNIRLDWTGLPGKNTLAFYENPIKQFYDIGPW